MPKCVKRFSDGLRLHFFDFCYPACFTRMYHSTSRRT